MKKNIYTLYGQTKYLTYLIKTFKWFYGQTQRIDRIVALFLVCVSFPNSDEIKVSNKKRKSIKRTLRSGIAQPNQVNSCAKKYKNHHSSQLFSKFWSTCDIQSSYLLERSYCFKSPYKPSCVMRRCKTIRSSHNYIIESNN